MMQPQQIDRYEILGELGRGGMATVYKARDPRFQREVAIKVLPREFLHDPTFRERFNREAQIIATLEHPAIVPVYDYGDHDGQPYLVMRYMPGGSLSDRLKQGPVSIPEAAVILSRLAAALEQAHREGVIHRDLKPQNILFDQYGDSYLSDFGSARIAQASTALTGDSIIGTPAYMSPEQARGDEELDGRSDIYALGAILFEMLSGHQPYDADTPMGVAVKHITEPVPRILEVKSDLPAGVEAVISRAMAKEPHDRYQYPSQIPEALHSLAAGSDTLETAETRSPLIGATPPPPAETPAAIQQPISPALPEDDYETPGSDRGYTSAWEMETGDRPSRPAGPLGIPRWIWILGGIIVLGGLCGVVLIGGGTLAVLFNQSNPPLPSTLVATQPPAEILFQDDFSNTGSGWDRFSDENALTDYERQGYRIWVNSENSYYWANPGLTMTDTVIEVDTQKIGGPDDNDFGVICRYQDTDNFYFFLITSDGYYSINKYSQGELVFLNQGSYEFDEAIRQGTASNHLEASCIQDDLQLRVNGKALVEIQDSEFSSGDIGLIAGTFDEPGADILFDNFMVTRP